MNILKLGFHYRHLKLFKHNLFIMYELKKKKLLDVNKTQMDLPLEKKLIVEINLLAKVLGEDAIDENSISSVRFYPTKYK